MFLFIGLSVDTFVKLFDLNTSHVLIYRNNGIKGGKYMEFKYISCSYLSEYALSGIDASLEFKYISCSYLSSLFHQQCVYRQSFKYISCSYLSDFALYFLLGASNLNTSHVLIYLELLSMEQRGILHLNTSHVLIYLLTTLATSLSFIYLNTSHVLIYQPSIYHFRLCKKFKYISCSYLS